MRYGSLVLGKSRLSATPFKRHLADTFSQNVLSRGHDFDKYIFFDGMLCEVV